MSQFLRVFVPTITVTLTHSMLVDSSAFICWTSPCAILGVSVYCVAFIVTLLANKVDPEQTPHYVASVLGLHCLPLILFTGFLGKYELNIGTSLANTLFFHQSLFKSILFPNKPGHCFCGLGTV